VLQDAGFAVDTACNGHEALSMSINAKPQAMVLDVGYPVLRL
jgi:DNA-binding response OmpR family regulator